MNDRLRVVDIHDFVRIQTPAEWRALLMNTAVGVLDQRVNIPTANAVVGLSAEVHKSLKQEFEMRCYVSENLAIKDGRVVRLTAPAKDA